MNRKVKIKNAFTLAEGGHSPLLYGDEGTQGSPRFEIWQVPRCQNKRKNFPLLGGGTDQSHEETIVPTKGWGLMKKQEVKI